ncbi:MAG: HEAT repeat domain-containing protein [Kiritimatiellia bacterium]
MRRRKAQEMGYKRVPWAACVLAGALLAAAPAPAAKPLAADPMAIEKTIAQLDSADWMLQSEAIALLGQWKAQEAVPRLTAMLSGKQGPWLAGAALMALAKISGSNVLEKTVTLSEDAAPELRGSAAEALGIIGGADALAAVRRRLEDADARVRYRAAAVYALLRGKEAWPDLAPLMAKPPAEAIEQAARALGYVGTDESRARIQVLLATNNVAAHPAVLFGLRDTRDPEIVPLLLQYLANLPARSDRAGPCMDLLQSYGADFLARPLVEVFQSGKSNVWVAACSLLYAHPATEPAMALAAAMEKLSNPSDELVLAALSALSTPKACPARRTDLFARYLTHRDPKCRSKAAACLGLSTNADLYALLRASLTDADGSVVRSALLALSRMPPESLPIEGIVGYLGAVLERKGPPDFEILRIALTLMATRGKPDEFPQALAALDPILNGKDGRLRYHAVGALRQLGGQAHARQLAAAQGYVLDWMLIGTFLNDEYNSGLTNAFPPETEINFKTNYVARYIWTGLESRKVEDRSVSSERTVEWQPWKVDESDGKVVLKDAMPPPGTWSVAYGVGDVAAVTSKTVSVDVTATGPFLFWLNGRKTAESTNNRPGSAQFTATLKQGENRFMIKSCTVRGEWWFSVQINEADEAPPKKR